MAFETSSRYYDVETIRRIVTDRNGNERILAHKKRRVIPSYDEQPTLIEHRFAEGNRLDNITARYLGDPTLFWRVCDANNVVRPEELEEISRVIRIAMAPT